MARSSSVATVLALACGATLALYVAGSSAAAQSTSIRNTHPQQPTTPPSREDPLYYPFQGDATTGLAALPEESPEYLLQQVRDLHSSLKHEQALLVAEQLVALVPSRPLAHYNHACVLARLRRTDDALAALDRAVDTGWRELRHTAYDLDLEPVRHHPAFRTILDRMKSLQDAEAAPRGPLRTDDWTRITEELQSEIPAVLLRDHVPGVSIALLRGGEVVWSDGFGLQHDPDGAPMTGDARFRLHAPVHMLALAASLQQQRQNDVDVAQAILSAAAPRPVSDRYAPAIAVRHEVRRRPARRIRATPNDTFAMLRLIVEVTSGMSFADYCASELAAADAMSLAFDEQQVAPVRGHSRLGTPLPTRPSDPGATVLVTAVGLGHLVCSMATGAIGADLGLLYDELASTPGLPAEGALALERTRTEDGRRYQLTGEHDGVGCLVRWYPESEIGVVVLYNGQGGHRAADRIASLALGGH